MAKKRHSSPFSQPGTHDPANPLDITIHIEEAVLGEVELSGDLVAEDDAPIYEHPDFGQMGAAIKGGHRKARKRLAIHRATGEWTRAS
jgi:hypothetical protein